MIVRHDANPLYPVAKVVAIVSVRGPNDTFGIGMITLCDQDAHLNSSQLGRY